MKISRAFAFFLSCTLAAAAQAQVVGTPDPCSSSPKCAPNCKNVPFEKTECWTTQYGPAAADVVLVPEGKTAIDSSNMLQCSAGPYALCFFSGPPERTGIDIHNNKLPCVVDATGKTANCSCQFYSNGVNYVDINGILNLGAYYETVAQCGHEGKKCRNLANTAACDKDPNLPVCQEAVVCQYIRNQNRQKPEQSLWPGADTISDFGFKMAQNYDMKAVTPCETGRYAGCMTAPCTFPGGVKPQDGGIVQCACPVVPGVFQIGQLSPDPNQPYRCNLGDVHVWSASNTIGLAAIAEP
jgi:hypothetical protein